MNVPPGLTSAALVQIDGMMRELRGMRGAIVATTDGFNVASQCERVGEPGKLAALASSLCAISIVAGEESGIGVPAAVAINAGNGMMVLVEIPHPSLPMLLALFAGKDAVLGQLVYRGRIASSQLSEVSA